MSISFNQVRNDAVAYLVRLVGEYVAAKKLGVNEDVILKYKEKAFQCVLLARYIGVISYVEAYDFFDRIDMPHLLDRRA